jgi:D-alanine-D-alanine ligase
MIRADKVIGIVHNEPIAEGQPNWESSVDVMEQVDAIEASLTELGYRSARIAFNRDLGRFVHETEEARIAMAFNLCESVDDNPQFVAHPAAVLELMEIPFTGSPSSALMATTDKHSFKMMLRAAGLNTPASLLFSGEEDINFSHMRFPVILKPQFQDASIGIDQESVISDPDLVTGACRDLFSKYGPILVEEYIDGREFNISLIGSSQPEVFPVAEIDFTGYPDSLHRIVGYRAKWEPESVEYRESRRIFPTLSDDVYRKMSSVSAECYTLFGLRDYGRVDLRLDRSGKIYVLEINANPCLSPDAGFPAAAQQSGLGYTAMVEKIMTFVSARAV